LALRQYHPRSINGNEIGLYSGFAHRLANAHEIVALTQAELEAHRLAATKLAQARDEMHQLDRGIKFRMGGRLMAILAFLDPSGARNFPVDCVNRSALKRSSSCRHPK
jgi:hypothetical protein